MIRRLIEWIGGYPWYHAALTVGIVLVVVYAVTYITRLAWRRAEHRASREFAARLFEKCRRTNGDQGSRQKER